MRAIKPKVDEYASGPMMSAKKKERPRYPMIRLPLEVIPEAKKWKVVEEGTDKGPSYTITLKVRQIGLSDARFDKSAEFELRGIETGEYDSKEEKEES